VPPAGPFPSRRSERTPTDHTAALATTLLNGLDEPLRMFDVRQQFGAVEDDEPGAGRVGEVAAVGQRAHIGLAPQTIVGAASIDASAAARSRSLLRYPETNDAGANRAFSTWAVRHS